MTPGAIDPVARLMVDFQQMKAFAEHPFIIESARGVYLYDDAGKEYIDGMAGVFVVSLGHTNSSIIEAVTDQLHRLSFAPPLASTSPPAVQLAEKICSLLPDNFNVLKFASGGSEAVEAGLKMARQYHKQTGNPEKYKMIAAYGAYHGGTLGALSATGTASRRNSFEPLMGGVVHVHPPNFAQCPLRLSSAQCEMSCALQFEEAIRREGPETVAAVILEPVMNVEGLIIPPPSYFQAIRQICDRYNVLLIHDEIISGYGRTGTMFFSEQTGIWPDILCIGKGMSSGYAPLAATVSNDKVAAAFWGEAEARVQFNGGHTYAGNPLACAAGLAVLEYFEQRDVLEHVAEVGPYLGQALRTLREKYAQIRDIRGLGLWWGVEFAPDNPTGLASDDIGRRIERAARERGLVLRGAPTMVSFGPPLVITKPEIDDMVHRLDLALQDVLHG